MARGDNYFVWVDPGTPWSDGLKVYSEPVFSFRLSQTEGQFAQLNLTLLNPKVGVLDVAAGRKLWAWFAHECDDSGGLIKMYGRLFGIPTSLVGELVNFLFRARPTGYEDLKRALLESMKIKPWYSRSFVDPQREADDPDVVLEAYTKVLHTDRETHQVTASDEIVGEDGLIVLTNHLYDGLQQGIPTGPISRVVIPARFNWTQKATGLGFNLGKYITQNWPHEEGVGTRPFRISSFTFGAGSWPKAGTSLGNGWVVTFSQTTPLNDLTVRHHSETFTLNSVAGSNFLSATATANWPTNEYSSSTTSISFDYVGAYPDYELSPAGSVAYNPYVTADSTKVEYSDFGGFGESQEGSFGSTSIASLQRNYAETRVLVPLLDTIVHMFIGFDANRPMTEAVRITMQADVQPVHTDPEDDMELLLPDLQSVDLATVQQIGEYTILPIGNSGYRSYLMLEQGQDDLKYLVALGRAHLLKRSRCVEIKVAPFSEIMPLVSLRKSMQIYDDRIPGGVAVGKIVAYSISLEGSSGTLEREVTINCCVGKGGSPEIVPANPDSPGGEHTFSEGTPIYAVEEYMVPEYQEYENREIPLNDGTGESGMLVLDTGYTSPLFNPNDDGLDILAPDLDIEDLIEEPLAVLFPPAIQRLHLNAYGTGGTGAILVGGSPELGQQAAAEFQQAVQNALNQIQTQIRFKLKNMENSFVTDYNIDTKDLLVPMQIDLGGG